MAGPGALLIHEAKGPQLQSKRFSIPGKIIGDVILKKAEKPSRVFILLHGYSQSGEKIYSRLEPAISSSEHGESAYIIAPNGPYPMPERGPQGWTVGFSWYFYNFETDEYFIDMENAKTYLNGLIESLGLRGVPTTVVGFSQGGYLAPLFAKECPQVDHVIGIGCEFLKDEIEDPVLFRLDAIHGADDAVVDVDNAQNSHTVLKGRGAKGSYTVLPGEGHRISSAVVDCVKSLLV
jgi:predicted esterase